MLPQHGRMKAALAPAKRYRASVTAGQQLRRVNASRRIGFE
jgi:hypothetical protein